MTLILTSAPAGATVSRGDDELGETPLSTSFEVSANPIELTFSKPGYLASTISVVPAEGATAPLVRLRRRRGPSTGPTGSTLPIKTGL